MWCDGFDIIGIQPHQPSRAVLVFVIEMRCKWFSQQKKWRNVNGNRSKICAIDNFTSSHISHAYCTGTQTFFIWSPGEWERIHSKNHRIVKIWNVTVRNMKCRRWLYDVVRFTELNETYPANDKHLTQNQKNKRNQRMNDERNDEKKKSYSKEMNS